MGHQLARYTLAQASAYRMTAASTGADARPIARTASQARAVRPTTAPRATARRTNYRRPDGGAGFHDAAAGSPNDLEGER
ncbi:hypothetical protein C0216_30985 (plasmid) [Streptomyces globosus]|uniref:Uncharacterized protein n=1 Tax=Streptomyces globosus TaxID=68209 RepID=A0A344UAK6_9ACTN|nr:hypothetical protein C0216_30985 [Streptomyces globosus]